ncbi:MAG TPA: type II secretion system F family protein [Patescibacteria group bacterium]|nr:type II secretion system F family protein [Patescibacteria group bacterium]
MIAKKQPSLLSTLNKPHVSYKDREYFTENLGLLLKSAVPVGDALASLATTAQTKTMKQTLSQLSADIEAGYSLANAIERSGLVSGQTLALIRLGEQSGHLVENLQLAAQQEEKRHLFQAKIRSALLYPGFVLSVTLVVGLGVAWFLLPRLSETFSQLQVKLPLISRIMIGFGVFLRHHGVIAIPIFLVLLVAGMYVLFFAPKTKWIGQRMLFKLPGIGRLLTEVEIAQFGYLLGTLLQAGLPITKALTLLASASTAPQYQQFCQYLARSLDDGFSIKDSLNKYKNSTKLLPASVQQMIIAGERSGSLSDVLLVVGRTYEQKSDITTNNLETIMEPIMLLFVAGGVLLVAISVLLPIYSLLGGLNK